MSIGPQSQLGGPVRNKLSGCLKFGYTIWKLSYSVPLKGFFCVEGEQIERRRASLFIGTNVQGRIKWDKNMNEKKKQNNCRNRLMLSRVESITHRPR